MAGTAIKLARFFGEAPKISPELLPDTVGQYAFNLELSSGDLQPYRLPAPVAALDKPGTIKTIYPLVDTSTGELKWLHWTTDVDVARAQLEGDTTQRIYYTGDGAPKVTNYALATSGSQYPTQSYTLGLPLPAATPVATATTFTTAKVSTYARDAGNTATIVTAAAHGLTTGDYVTISKVDDNTFNLTNTPVTVVNSTTFTYFNFGGQVATTTETTDSGFTAKTVSSYARDASGVATIVTTAVHTLAVGDYVTLTNIDNVSFNTTSARVLSTPTTSSFTYSSPGAVVSTTSETTAPLGQVVRVNQGTVELAGSTLPRTYVFTYYSQWDEESVPSEPSETIFVKEGQTVTISGLPSSWTHGAGYNTTGMKVRIYRSVVGVSGTFYFKVGEVNLGTTTFTDDVDVSTLDELLESEDYDAPPSNMQGLLAIHNNMLVGFFGNTVCFSEPGKPHAWPIKYRRQVDADIISLAAFGTTLLALTDRTPWKFDGNNPAAVSSARTDYILPCLSKRSVINIGFGVVWSSAGGLAVYSTSIGTDYLTKNVHSWTTWPIAVTPSALYGAYYRGRYFGSDGTSTFLFERNDQIGGHLVETDIQFTAAHYRAAEDAFYYAHDGVVYLWNAPQAPAATLDWKSKVFTTKSPINMGAARVIADYGDTESAEQIAAQNAAIVAANAALIAGGTNPMGALATSMANELTLATSSLTPLIGDDPDVLFQLFVNKELVFTRSLTSSEPFRMPTGYRADTFEIRVATKVRIRAIHLAETMQGLKGT